MDVEQARLDRHGALIRQLVRLCSLQNTMLSLIAAQLHELGVAPPAGVGSVALSIAEAQRHIEKLIVEEDPTAYGRPLIS